jgi:hypothetical protein
MFGVIAPVFAFALVTILSPEAFDNEGDEEVDTAGSER